MNKLKSILKHITVIATLLAALSLRSIAASPEAEARFIANAKAAFDTKNSTNLLNLVCWDRVTPTMKEMVAKQLTYLVQKPVAHIELVAPDPADNIAYTRNGITYQANLTVVKQLKITFKSDSTGLTSTGLPIGEKGGRMFITTAAPAK